MNQQSLARPDHVKMDIEGAEWPLFGKPAWLDRVDSISVEVHQRGWLDEIEATLNRAAFATARSKDHWALITGIAAQGESPARGLDHFAS